MVKIKIPDHKYEAMFESKIVPSGNGAVAKALKRYVGKEVVILVKKDYDLVGKDGSFDKMDFN